MIHVLLQLKGHNLFYDTRIAAVKGELGGNLFYDTRIAAVKRTQSLL